MQEEIDRRIDPIVQRSRDPLPMKIRFTTWTLRYNQCQWLTVDGLEKHWERARVDAARNREALLAAAQRLLRKCGPDGITMDAVACEAGVGKGTLFRRFRLCAARPNPRCRRPVSIY